MRLMICALSMLVCTSAQAADPLYRIEVLIDRDRDGTTGCDA